MQSFRVLMCVYNNEWAAATEIWVSRNFIQQYFNRHQGMIIRIVYMNRGPEMHSFRVLMCVFNSALQITSQ
jgi:hypothetical protein